jgi:DNA-binding response OmpR family regulator
MVSFLWPKTISFSMDQFLGAQPDPEVKIIGTSGFVGDANNRVKMDDLRRLGVTKIIKKPFQRRELLTVLAAILRAKAAETRLPETAARPTSAG